MVEKIVNLAIAALVLWLIYVIAGYIVALLSLPALVLTIVLVLLLLAFILYLIRSFGIKI